MLQAGAIATFTVTVTLTITKASGSQLEPVCLRGTGFLGIRTKRFPIQSG